MNYILILLMVCLLWQAAVTVLLFAWKHRFSQRMDALLRYVDRCLDGLDSMISEQEKKMERFSAGLKDAKESVSAMKTDITQEMDSKLSEQEKTVKELVDSLLLDYTQAVEAANKINDFGATLANIFDYDPIETLKRNRQKVGT